MTENHGGDVVTSKFETFVITVGVVVTVVGVVTAIVIACMNGSNNSRRVRLACIDHGGTYVQHTCFQPR